MSVITLQNISKNFQNKEILRNISLEISAGKRIGILGPSGCGKSTLLSLISGLELPTSGTLKNSFLPKETAFVFQESALMPWRTVFDNIALPLELIGTEEKAKKAKVLQLLKVMGLESFSAYFPAKLSVGMKMRVSLARALATDPKLLLLDEPFASLDQILKERLMFEMSESWLKEPRVWIFVSHNIFETIFLCDEIYILAKKPTTVLHRFMVERNSMDQKSFWQSPLFLEQAKTISSILESHYGYE